MQVFYARFAQAGKQREDIKVSVYAGRIARVYHGLYPGTVPLTEGVEKFENNNGKRGLACMD